MNAVKTDILSISVLVVHIHPPKNGKSKQVQLLKKMSIQTELMFVDAELTSLRLNG